MADNNEAKFGSSVGGGITFTISEENSTALKRILKENILEEQELIGKIQSGAI